MLLTVTQEHIDMGTIKDASGCPLALSIRDYLGEPDALVLVDGGGTVWIGPEDTGILKGNFPYAPNYSCCGLTTVRPYRLDNSNCMLNAKGSTDSLQQGFNSMDLKEAETCKATG